MSLKYFKGVGPPPPFVELISFGPSGGIIRIRYAETATHDIPYETSNGLANKIEILVRHKLPFLAEKGDGGVAEIVATLIALKKLILVPPYIKISWPRPRYLDEKSG